jgi:hypothetical protein
VFPVWKRNSKRLRRNDPCVSNFGINSASIAAPWFHIAGRPTPDVRVTYRSHQQISAIENFAVLQRIMALAMGLLRSRRLHPSWISCEITDLDIGRERAMFRANNTWPGILA